MHFLLLFNRYIIRDLVKNRARVALTIAGIALGISVVVAVQLANDRAIGSFNSSVQILAGDADLQITANGQPLPEDLIPKFSWVWDYGSMTPVVQARGIVDRQAVQIFGIDLLSEMNGVNARTGTGAAPGAADGLRLLLDPAMVMVTEALATRIGLANGSSFDLLIGDRRETLTAGAVLGNDGAARAFSGNVIFMDIAAAQLLLRRIGVLDRINVHLRNKADLEAVRTRIRESLPATAVVDVPESAALQSEKLLRAFRYNLTALSYISLIVGVMLIYNTLTIAVIRRRPEIGMLRTMGAPRSTIAALFLIEAACLGLVGAAIGIGFGEVMARAAGVMVTRTIEALYTGVFALPTGGAASPAYYTAVAAGGVLLSIISGLAPAIRATGVSPVSVFRRGIAFAGGTRRTRRSYVSAAAGLSVIALAAATGQQPPLNGFPFFGYASAILLIIGFGLLSPAFSQLVLGILSPVLKAALPIEGRLAVQSMKANQSRIVTAVLSLAIAVAMLVSVVTMVSSFRDTIIVWVNQTLRADLYIRPAGAGPNDWSNTFEPATVAAITNLPSVAAIDRYRGRALQFDGNPIVLAAGEFSVMGRYGDQVFVDGRSAADITPRMIGQNRVIVSEPFSIKQGPGKGDTIMLPTVEGVQPFEIENVYYDYSNDRGTIVMDRSTYVQLFHDTSVTNIAAYLRPGADVTQAQQQIAAALPNAQIRVFANADLKQQVLRVFDQTFQVTYALEAIALIVAILGITNTLSALILERRPEFAMLRFVGADRRQLRNVVVLESGVTGLIGTALGCALGIALSVVLVFVINKQSFGWTIQFAVPGWFLAQSLSLIVLATIVAGLYPATLATRLDAIQGIRAE